MIFLRKEVKKNKMKKRKKEKEIFVFFLNYFEKIKVFKTIEQKRRQFFFVD